MHIMIVHVTKRGGRGLPIVHDDADRYDFVKCLYYLNDANHPRPWRRDVDALGEGLQLKRPEGWPGERSPYVDILSYCLQDNHFHLLLREREDGGTHQFLKSLGASMTQAYNQKYNGSGSIFQGRPQKRFVESGDYLRKLFVYINVKNVFEQTDKSLDKAVEKFEDTFAQALNNPFSSLPDIMDQRSSPIIEKEVFADSFGSPAEFKEFAREQMNYSVFVQEIESRPLD